VYLWLCTISSVSYEWRIHSKWVWSICSMSFTFMLKNTSGSTIRYMLWNVKIWQFISVSCLSLLLLLGVELHGTFTWFNLYIKNLQVRNGRLKPMKLRQEVQEMWRMWPKLSGVSILDIYAMRQKPVCLLSPRYTIFLWWFIYISLSSHSDVLPITTT
jgi:hypothetical protein